MTFNPENTRPGNQTERIYITPKRSISRRTAVVGGVVGGLTLCCGGTALGLFLGKRQGREANPEVTAEYLSSLTATLIANETEISNQGLTPTPSFTETIFALATATATPIPTLTATPSPELTATPDRFQKRKELLSSQEVNPWDAAATLPPDTTNAYLMSWMTRINQEVTLGNLQKGDVRTYDQILETSGPYSIFWLANDVQHAFDVGDGRKVWVPQDQEGNLYQAKDADYVLSQHVSDFVSKYGGDTNLARSVFLTIRKQIFVPGSREGTLLTRNTYLGLGNTREAQPEIGICSAYIQNVDIGKEFIDGGILFLSNKASTPMIFVDSDHAIGVDDQARLAKVKVDFSDGQRRYLFVRMFDIASRPRPELFGNYGLVIDDESKGGWGSQILPPCGEAPVVIPTVISSPTPAPSGNVPGGPPPQIPTRVNTQPAPTQDIPPTRVNTQPAP